MRRTSITTGALLVLGACASAHVSTGNGGDDDGDDDDGSGGVDATGVLDPDARRPDGGAPSLPDPVLESLDFECKLINDRNLDDPSGNDTHQRVNLRGTDLGIPVAHGSDLYFFFGDTAGDQVIWPMGPESLPDAVGYASATAAQVAADPGVLCTQLRFLKVNSASGTADADFAGTWMSPPPGQTIGAFVKNPAGPRGQNAFPNMPGDFEVPTGAFSYNGAIYVFYSTVNLDPLEMRGSYLAKWNAPSRTGLPTYDILYPIDQRFTANGPLRGDFINIAAVVQGDHVLLFGTGLYRQSPVHLARKQLATLGSPGGFERYDAASGLWVAGNAPAAPIVAGARAGELSVRYIPSIGRFVMLDQEVNSGNRIVARFAAAAEGPWSDPVTVALMTDPTFAARHCCSGTDCPGERMIECEHAAFYGTYMLPSVTANSDGSFSIPFVVSTHIPYNVALMTATFR
jgi:hypothetical protein